MTEGADTATPELSDPLGKQDIVAEARWRRVSSTHDIRALSAQEAVEPDSHLWDALRGLLLCSMALALVWHIITACACTVRAEAHDMAYLLVMQRVAALVPSTAVFVIINWFCIKLFKHNS